MATGWCIVVYDDDMGVCSAYSWCDECEGALGGSEPVVLFPNRRAARQAIAVSTHYAKLRKSQGKPYSEDFLSGRPNVKIRDVVFAEE